MPDMRGFDLIDELPDDGSRQKEVYARFGLAAFKAQVFDHALVNLLTVLGMIDGRTKSPEEIDQCFEDLFRKTTGRLIRDVADQARLESQDLVACRTAVAQRNRLIHSFFRDHAEDFMTSHGQQVMLDELGDISDVIQKADDACHRVTMTVAEPYGFTDELVGQHLLEMIESLGDGTKS